MWREELLHPFLAHLPIVLLPVAFLFRLGSQRWAFMLPSSRVLLALSVLGAWLAYWSGGIAEDVVNRVICDPTVTHEHEDLAFWTSLLASGALAFDVVAYFSKLRFFRALTWMAWIIGMVYLARASHLGASLVYQQGAAVYFPSPECKEFE